MKYLRVDHAKCNGGKECQKECEAACSKTFWKTEDALLSCVRLLPVGPKDGAKRIDVCNQCGACVLVCPVEALRANKVGVVLVDKKTCVGCQMCIGACATLSMRSRAGEAVVFKCIACGACAKVCPTKALEVVDVPKPEPRVAAH